MGLLVSVFIATSLDGFIAGEDGSLDWLDAANATVPEGEDCGYNAFINSVDVLIMGRNTYEKVLSFGAWPYGNKPVIVLSTHSLEIPKTISSTVKHAAESPQELYDRLSKDGAHRIYVDGGITIQRFINAGLVDDITITVIPTLLAKGKALFFGLNHAIDLKLVTSKAYDFGFVQSTYEILKSK